MSDHFKYWSVDTVCTCMNSNYVNIVVKINTIIGGDTLLEDRFLNQC